MKINSESLQKLASKTLVEGQTSAAKLVNTTQELTTEAFSRFNKTKDEVNIFVNNTSNSMATATLQTAQEAERISRNLKFENLPTNLQLKFARAGVRKGTRTRGITETIKVFESIPAQVRAQGEDAVRKFCKDKDWSHIIARSKGGGNESSNGIFEYSQINRDRGSSNMTRKELSVARGILRQAAFRSTVTQVASAMTKGALTAASIELVFAILENSLLYAEGKISEEKLIDNVKDSTLKAGIAGAVMTALLMAISLVFPPIAILLGTVAVPLAIAGVGSVSIRAWELFCRADQVIDFTKKSQMLLKEVSQECDIVVQHIRLNSLPSQL